MTVIDLLFYGLMALLGIFAVACIVGAIWLHSQDKRRERDAAKYKRMERRRADLRAQRDKDIRLAVEWCALKIERAQRAKDAEWIARVIVMERWSVAA